jgi:hypothetical protein
MKSPVIANPNVTYEEQIDPANPGGWVMVEDNESYRRWELDLGDRIVLKTEHKGTQQLLADNQRCFNENEGKRWGDGQVVSSVPMNIYFGPSGLSEANKQKDIPYIRKWLNDPDHRKFRKFKGSI